MVNRHERAHFVPPARCETTATPGTSASLKASAGGASSTVIPIPDVMQISAKS
jgi:hypothetical protein